MLIHSDISGLHSDIYGIPFDTSGIHSEASGRSEGFPLTCYFFLGAMDMGLGPFSNLRCRRRLPTKHHKHLQNLQRINAHLLFLGNNPPGGLWIQAPYF